MIINVSIKEREVDNSRYKKLWILKMRDNYYKENRLEYYEALDKAHTTGNYTDFVKLIIKLEIEMLKKYLKLIKWK